METHTNEIVKCPGRPHAAATPTLCAAARTAPDRPPDLAPNRCDITGRTTPAATHTRAMFACLVLVAR
eukprot:714388-Prymnesium_polylepis.1